MKNELFSKSNREFNGFASKDFIISTSKNEKKDKIFEQAPLKLRDDKRKGVIIQGAKEIAVNTFYDVFQILKKGELNRKKRETINYVEFSERMHSLSLRQRTLFMNKKKNFCEKIKEEAIQNSKLRQAQKLMAEQNQF